MIDISDVEKIHNLLIDKFGGSRGVRDRGALEAAIARPFMTFENIDLYPSPIDKAAAILESIFTNHPFIDGNKRTGYVLVLLYAGLDIDASQEEKYELVMEISKVE
jgi:death on curing protein